MLHILKNVALTGVLFLASGFAAASVKVVPQHRPTTSQHADIATSLRQNFNAETVLKADVTAAERNALAAQSSSLPETVNTAQVSFTEPISQQRTLQPMGQAVRSERTAPSQLRTAANGTAKIVEGYYIAKDFVHNGNEVNCVMQVVADASDATMIHIHNFYGLEETIDAVVNVTTGELSILPQRIWQSTSYGDVYMFPISYEDDKVKFYPSQPVVGSIDSEGVIRLPQWGAIVGQGENANMMLAAIDRSEYYPANATINASKRTQEQETAITYPILLEQSNPAELTIYNFGTTGVPVKARIASNGTVTVSPQYIATMGLYGDFHCFPINTQTGSIDKTSPINGSVSNGKISFSPWVAGSIMQDGLVALWLTSSELIPNEGFSIQVPQPAAAQFEGNGTQASPWLIKTATDLRALSEAAQKNSFYGRYFKLTADIDMAGEKGFVPIGSNTAAFNGSFDGDGHTISNLHIDAVGYHFQGLFGALYTNSVIKNVNITSSSLNGSGYYLGILAGYSQGLIENCHVNGDISGNGMCVGGVIGRSYGTVSNCSFSGSASACGYVGGIAGYSYGEISNCSSDASVTLPKRLTNGAACVGGIAGLAQSFSTAREGKLTECRFSGTVEQGSGYGFAGGIAGYTYAVAINRCLNTGSVAATATNGTDEQTGGIAGIIRDSEMADCLNAGAISCASSSEGTGGLIGYITCTYSSVEGMAEPVYINNCYNSGQIIASARTEHAGIFGTEFTMDGFDEKPSDSAFTNVYSDNQATGLRDERFGKATTFFTSTLPQGFSSGIWTAAAGLYPTLKAFDSTNDGKLAAAAITFATGESTRAMKTTASLTAPEGITWQLLSNGQPADVSTGLTKNGNSLSLREAYANDTIVAVNQGTGITGRRYVINVVPKVFNGEGTAQNPFKIQDKADFVKLHDAIMHYDHEGDHFLQTADVDFGLESDFSGVAAGNHLKAFAGTFDGGNHLIKGLRIKSLVTDASGTLLQGTYNYGGLFHIGTATSVIKNVIIDASCDFNFYGQSAPVIGYTLGRVENCRNYAAVNSGTTQIAGIVGYLELGGSVNGCYNAGAVNASGNYTGGIVGQNMGDIADSQNDGNITTTGKYAGGIAGASAGSINFSVNSGTVTGPEYVGGIIGSLSTGYNMGDISDCLSSGIINCEGSTRGGVVGYANGRGTIERNIFDGSINNMDGCSSLSQGFTALATIQLVSDQAPEGFNSDKFTFSAAAYPSLKAYASETSGIGQRAIFIRLDKGEKLTNVIRSIDLSADPLITWTLKNNKDFTISNGKLTVSNAESQVVTDTLTAVYGNTFTKIFPLKSIPSILPGSGSKESPFLITSANDLNLLASFMESSGMDYDGYSFRVENDIEYSAETAFNPIARTGVQFQGDFDGNGKTISKFAFTDETSKTGKNIGFFGTIGSKGYVHDLVLDGEIKAYSYTGSFAGLLYGRISNCESRCSINGKGGYAAGFAGRMYDGASIENSVFTGKVNDAYTSNINYAGGFTGQLDNGASIDHCINRGTVGNFAKGSGTTYTGHQYVGGIAAMNLGSITNCRNEGKVQGRIQLGGIAGRIGKTTYIADCVNSADIEALGGGYVGGIAPQTTGSGITTITRCSNSGNLRGKGYVAGIIGAITSGNGIQMDHCFNTGKISGFSATAYGVGGIIGQMQASASYMPHITNCWNSGDIYNEAQSTGGFAGKITAGVVTDCWNTGNVTVAKETEDQSQNGVGGFAGAFSASAERIWNSGNVTSNVPSAGGIFGTGAMPIAKVNHAVNLGNVTVSRVIPEKGYAVGGIWGGYGPAEISDCYNYGTITAPDNVAGINGGLWSNANGGSSIVRCYNAGKVVATSSSPVAVSNIATISTASGINATLMHTDSVYFDAEACTILQSDNIGTGLTTAQLMKADLGQAYTYRKACLPTLAFMDSVPAAAFHAVNIEFNDGDNADNVNGTFHVGIMPHILWTSSDNLSIDADGVVTVIGNGEGWVKATTDDPDSTLEKVFKINMTSTGIEQTTANGREIKNREWYQLNGTRVAAPTGSGVYIVKTVFTDGTSDVCKVAVKAN